MIVLAFVEQGSDIVRGSDAFHSVSMVISPPCTSGKLPWLPPTLPFSLFLS
jgi:hypothetical protein